MHSMHSSQSVQMEDQLNKEDVVSSKSSTIGGDGGYGWVIVICTFLAFSSVAFHFMAFGIFASELADAFSLSESEIGLIASLRTGVGSLTGILAGPLVQRFGCRLIAIFGVLACMFANVATAVAKDNFTITVSYGLIAGIGEGLTIIPSIVIVQQYFTTRRAIAAGISSVGMGFFALVCSPLARLLVDSFGWRGACLLFGGFSIQMLVPTALYRPPKQHRKNPLSKINAEATQLTCTRRMKTMTEYFVQKDLLTRYFLLYLVANTTKLALLDIYYMRMALIGRSFGIVPLKAAILPSMIAAMSTTARGLSGFLTHWAPPHVLFGVFNIISAAVVFIVPLLPKTFLAHAIFGAIFGFCMGTVFGIESTTLVTLVGVNFLPMALSLCCLFDGIFRITNNLIVGWLLDETDSYRLPLWYAATVHGIGSLFALAIVFLKRKENKKRPLNIETISLKQFP